MEPRGISDRGNLGLASFARQKRAKRSQVQVEVFHGEAEVVPQLVHPGFEGHQRRSDLLDLIVGERSLLDRKSTRLNSSH